MVREVDSSKCTARVVRETRDGFYAGAEMPCRSLGLRRCLIDASRENPFFYGAKVTDGRCRADYEETSRIFQIRKAIGALVRKPQ